MIDEEKKLTTISFLKTPKYKRFSPSHGHIMKFTLRREKKKKTEEDLLRKGGNLGTEE